MTAPPPPATSTSFALDDRAYKGFSNASLYDAHRPSYPAEAVSKLLSHLNIADLHDAQVVELACGTGKFTELLSARPEEYEIIAVEPHVGMREEMLKKGLGERVKILDGDAGNMPIEEGWGDALIAAQAFHWFATDEALAEISRVLRPGAAFGMIWNIEDYNAPQEWEASTKWEQKLKDILAALEDGQPRFRHLKWREVFEKQQDTTPLQTLKDIVGHNLPKFSLPIGEEDVVWTIYLEDQAVWSRYSTLSQIANLEEDKREEIKKEVLAELKKDGVGRNSRGEIAVGGRTHIAWTSRV